MFEDLFLAYAIGDAFGAGVEFQDRDWIRQHVDFSRLVNARASIRADVPDPEMFTRHYTPWEYSDDTEMTIGTARALLSGRPFTAELLIEYWSREYQSGVATKGYGRNGHGSMRWVYSGAKSIEEVWRFQATREYPGNAAPMRAVPLGFAPSHLIDDYALINADATHPHPKARAANILVARACRYLLVEKQDPAKLIHNILPFLQETDRETADLLLQIDRLPPPHLLQPQHYTLLCGPQPIREPRFPEGIHGLPSDAMLTAGAVAYMLKHFRNTFSGLQFAIRLGGDVDTVAGIVTGILAGRYGSSSLPGFMRRSVEGIPLLRELAKDFGRWVSDNQS
ncbi:ADP-ribosylglycohydrolase family protein [Flavilitoribacter nigricans]|nr:ADP-ribosylglycohydrolase family protein [Flavilitoribacter nigricans]